MYKKFDYGILFVLFFISFLIIAYTGNIVKSQPTDIISDLPNKTLVRIANTTIIADIADSPEEQSKGLSIKDDMAENEGMLFVFDTPKKHSFWMKDMKFSIDITWIDENKKIVHIEENLKPCVFLGLCPSFAPEHNSLYVLEVIDNFTNKYNVSVGDTVDFNLTNNTNT